MLTLYADIVCVSAIVILLIAYSVNSHCNVGISNDNGPVNFYFCYVLSFKCVNGKNYFM